MMRSLEASELLQIWERGDGLPPAQAVLLLLLAACPEIPADHLSKLTIGERDALLLTQREWMFGTHMDVTAICPKCGALLEFSMEIDDVRAIPAQTDAGGFGQTTAISIKIGAYEVAFHPPTIAEFRHATTLTQLLDRCLLSASKNGEDQTANELPPAVMDAISHKMAAADPQADIQLSLTCPDCEQEWLTPFDISAFLWREIKTWAQRTLLEVHQLARAYGWSEMDILTLTPSRRQIYLRMIGAYE